MVVTPIKTRIFQPNESMIDFLLEHLPTLQEDSILVITSKIIALSEGRLIKITTEEEKDLAVKAHSNYAYRHPYGWLSIVDGLMVGSAGLDASNVEGDFYSLLPKDCFLSAEEIRTTLCKHFKIERFGVVITDSRLMPLRKGTLGAAFGYAGIKALRNYVGQEDLHGRPYERQKANIPDALATSAVLVMGEGAEQHPLALINDAPVEFTNSPTESKELVIPVEDDVYYFFYKDYKNS